MSNWQQLLDRYYDRSKVSTARRGALAAYVRAEGPDAVNLCVNALDDPEPTIRKEALRLLADLRAASAVEPLTGRLEEADGETQRRILATLAAIGDESARPAIERLAASEDFFIRSAARRALRELDEPPVTPAPIARKPLDIDLLGEPATQISREPPAADADLPYAQSREQGPATLDPTAFREFSVHDIKLQQAVREAEANARAETPSRVGGEKKPRQPQRARHTQRRQPSRQMPEEPPAEPKPADTAEPVDVRLGPSRPLPGRRAQGPPVAPPAATTRPVERLEPVRVDDAYQAYLARRAAAGHPAQRARQPAARRPQRARSTPRQKARPVITFALIVALGIFALICGQIINALR